MKNFNLTCDSGQKELLIDDLTSALKYVKGDGHHIKDCDICESGAVYHGLTQIIEPGNLYAGLHITDLIGTE